jgi:hypothetical protein
MFGPVRLFLLHLTRHGRSDASSPVVRLLQSRRLLLTSSAAQAISGGRIDVTSARSLHNVPVPG